MFRTVHKGVRKDLIASPCLEISANTASPEGTVEMWIPAKTSNSLRVISPV